MEKSRAPEFERKAAMIWDAMYGPYAQKELEFITRAYTRATGKEAGSVLDIGCGTGRYVIPLAKRGWSTLGIDSSAEMLKILDKKALREKVSVPAVHMNFEEYVSETQHDLVLSFFCIIYICDDDVLQRFFSRVKQSISKNGLFIFNFFNFYDYWNDAPVVSHMGKTFTTGNTRVSYTTTPVDSRRAQANVDDFRSFTNNGNITLDLTSRKIRFYTVMEIEMLLKKAGFRNFEFYSGNEQIIENNQPKNSSVIIVSASNNEMPV